MAKAKKKTKPAHHRECEIVGYGVCTCGYWEAVDKAKKQDSWIKLYGNKQPFPR